MNKKSIFLLFAVAVFLVIIPVPNFVRVFMPQWLLVLSLFAMYQFPLKFGLTGMFLMGLFQDLLLFNFIGMEALLFVIIGFAFRRIMGYLFASSGISRALFFAVLLLVYHFLKIILWWFVFDIDVFGIDYLAILISVFVGTVLVLILKKWFVSI